jgi:hypothetical protein
LPISGTTTTRDKVLLTRLLSSTSTLTALFIHVVDVLHWDVMFLNNLKKEVEMSSNNWTVKCLATLRVQARWSSKLDLRPTIKEPVDPADTWLSTTKSLGFFSDSPLVEWMSRIREENDPVGKDFLCLRGKELLLNMCVKPAAGLRAHLTV